MAQEGEVRQHPNGGTYKREGGVWVLQGAAPAPAASGGVVATIPGPAKQPAPQTALQVQNDVLTNQRLQQQIAGEGQLPPEKRADYVARAKALPDFYRSLDEIEGLYNDHFAGDDKGAILGMGGDRNVSGRLPDLVAPKANQRLTSASDSLIGVIAKIQGATGGEMNSLAELRARFGPMLPQPTDNDQTIEDKLARLRAMADTQRSSIGAVLGEPVEIPAPDNADTSTQYVVDPGAGQAKVSTKTQTVTDEKLAAVAGPTGMLVTRGAPLSRIEGYLNNKGVDPAVLANLREIVRQRDIPGSEVNTWIKQNPGKPYPIDPKYEVPLSAIDEAVANISAGPVGAYGIAAGNVVTGNRLDNIIEATGGDADLANSLMGQVREDNFKSSLAGDVTGGALLGLGLGGAGRAVASRLPTSITLRAGGSGALAPGAIAGDGALGAYIGSGEGTDLISVEGALKGAVIGAGAGVAGRGVLNSAGRALSPTGGRLAPLYEGNPEFRPSLGQRVGGAYGRFEEGNTALPFLGGPIRNNRNAALDQAQRGGFNQALREIGTELPSDVVKGVRAHAYMQRAFNQAYDKARSGMRMTVDAAFGQEFGGILNDVDLLPPASQNTFRQLATQVGARLKARGGTLNGDDYKMLVSRVDAKARAIRKNQNGDGELADTLERFSLALDDAARRNSPPDAAAALDAADRGYVKAVIIENASKGAGGAAEFTGTSLENAAKNGSGGVRSRVFLRGEAPLQEYAGAMKQLGDTVPDSGTVPRLLATGGAGAVGALHPGLLAPSGVAVGANLPGVRNVIGAATSPNRRLRSPKARKVIIDRARLGGLFGVPLIEAQQQQ